MDSLRGKLLIAAPSLFDYFRRTVILVLEHSEDGAMGVVLNRRSETSVADAVPALASLPDADELVYVGGPVAPGSVVALGDFDDPDEAGTHGGGLARHPRSRAGRRCRSSACASTPATPAGPPASSTTSSSEGAWIVEAAEVEDPFTEGDIWSEALRRKGGEYSLLATMPGDPSVN